MSMVVDASTMTDTPTAFDVPTAFMEVHPEPHQVQTTDSTPLVPVSDLIAPMPENPSLAPLHVVEITAVQLLGYIWLAGVALYLLIHLSAYWNFRRRINKTGREPGHLMDVLIQQGCEMGIINMPRLMITTEVNAPMLIGVLKPCILLPHENYSMEELAFIFRHELVHYDQRHIWYKWLFLIANALHWFNPMVYLMNAQAVKTIELACDDAVSHGLDKTEREQYATALLAALPKTNSWRRVIMVSTQFGNGKKEIKSRLRNLFDGSYRRRGLIALCIVAVSALVITTIIRTGYAQNEEPTEVTSSYAEEYTLDDYAIEEGLAASSSSTDAIEWHYIMDEAWQWQYSYDYASTETTDIGSSYSLFHIPHIPAGERVLVGRIDGIEPGQRIELRADAMEGEGIFVGLSADPELCRYGWGNGSWRLFASHPSGSAYILGPSMDSHSHYVYFYVGSWSAEISLYDVTASVSISPLTESLEEFMASLLEQTRASWRVSPPSHGGIEREAIDTGSNIDDGLIRFNYNFHIPHIPAGERVLMGQIDDFGQGQLIEMTAEALEGSGIFIGLSADPDLCRYGWGNGRWRPFANDSWSSSVSVSGITHTDFVYLYVGSWSTEIDLYDVTASVVVTFNPN